MRLARVSLSMAEKCLRKEVYNYRHKSELNEVEIRVIGDSKTQSS